MNGNPEIAFVIPRYGPEILGGAEIHCRWIAERLAKRFSVEVLTTCAKDAVHWENHYSAGDHIINGLPVKRFSLSSRDKERFEVLDCRRQFNFSGLDETEEREWLRHMGPYSQDLLDYLQIHSEDYACFIFFTYLFPTSVFGSRIVADKTFLVPTVHDEPYIYLPVYDDLFRAARGIFFNCEEEREFTLNRFPDATGKHVVVGCGINYPDHPKDSSRFRKRYGIDKPYIVYVGKIDPGKGCDHLVEYFERYIRDSRRDIQLLLLGSGKMEIAKHLGIRAVGPVSEEDKYSLLAEAEVLVNPSQNESLSLALLESWAMGTPVLVNGKCGAMMGQCKRSNGGLWYENYSEFKGCLDWFFNYPQLSRKLAKGGKYYLESRYNWPVIEEKYLSLIGEYLR